MIRTISFLLLSSLIVLSWGCGAENPGNEPKNKKEQLAEYKTQMNELKRKIAALESDLTEVMPANMVNVEVSEIEPVLFERYIEAIGSVGTDQNIIVSPETGGIIRSIQVREGENVKKGQILAKLNTESIQQTLEEVKVNLKLASDLYERRKKLWEQNVGSEVEYLQAESNMKALEKKLQGLRAQMEMAVIKAPISGVIDDLIQKQGEMAGPSIPFARLVNLENVYITTDVSEKYLNRIKPGDSVSVSFPVPDLEKKAVIFRTSAIIDPDSRTFGVRVNLENKDRALQPNLMGNLRMRISRIPDALVVPSLLVKNDFKGEFLFLASEKNGFPVAEKKYISTRIKDNNNTVVSDGLQPGNKIITKGFDQVTDGTRLNIQ